MGIVVVVIMMDRRELVHMFRQRTLVLLKALMLQKKVRLDSLPLPPTKLTNTSPFTPRR